MLLNQKQKFTHKCSVKENELVIYLLNILESFKSYTETLSFQKSK